MEMYKDQSKTYQTRQESIPICNETVSQISILQRYVRHRIFQSIWLVALNTVKDRYCTILSITPPLRIPPNSGRTKKLNGRWQQHLCDPSFNGQILNGKGKTLPIKITFSKCRMPFYSV